MGDEAGQYRDHTPSFEAAVSPNTTRILCPECGSQLVWKDGIRPTRYGEVQRYLCRECGHRFSESTHGFSDVFRQSEHAQRIHRCSLKRMDNIPLGRQICVTQPKGAKNLVKVESRIEEAAGATKPDPATVKGKIVELAFWMKKQGYPESTYRIRIYNIKRLVDLGANLWDPETVKEVLAKQPWKDSYKKNIVYAYENFLQMEGLKWKRPGYKQGDSLPFVPLETELDQLIASSGKILGTFLQGLKDTGTDPGELARLEWIDINKQSRTVNIKHPVKSHKPRILGVSDDFINRLERLPKRGERIFNYASLTSVFFRHRKRASYKLANPRIEKISFTTFRHWKATTEYHRTKDILFVMKLLGHKSLRNTMKYIDLEKAIYGSSDSGEFTVKVAMNIEEACELVKVGFEYVTGEYNDGGKIFRQRK